MKNLKNVLLLVLILIIASFFRFYHLEATPPGLYPDEAMNGNNALEAITTGEYKVFYPENNGREGLFINIQSLFVRAFGNKPWALRIPSALFGILTVLGLYFLGKELFSKNIGLLAAFFMAVSFWHVNFSRIGFRAIMAPFFLTWALYLLIRSLHRGEAGQKNAYISAVIGGIFFSLGMYSYIAYRVAPLLIVFIVIYYWTTRGAGTRKSILRLSAIFIGASIIVALPIGIYFFKNPQDFLGRTSQISIFAQQNPIEQLGVNVAKTIGMFFIQGDWNWRHNYAGRPELFLPVGIFFLVGILAAMFRIRKRVFPNSILLLWFALGFLPVVISSEGLPHALRAILIAPPAFLFAAIGFRETYDFARRQMNPRLLRGLAAALFIIIFGYGYKSYFVDWARHPAVQGAFSSDYVELGRHLNSLSPMEPKYIVVNAAGTLVNGWPMPTQTVMFITDSYTPEKQKAKNIYYVLPEQESTIPRGALKFYLQ